MISSADPEGDRAFFRDVLEIPNIHAGSELGVYEPRHPQHPQP